MTPTPNGPDLPVPFWQALAEDKKLTLKQARHWLCAVGDDLAARLASADTQVKTLQTELRRVITESNTLVQQQRQEIATLKAQIKAQAAGAGSASAADATADAGQTPERKAA